MKKILKIFYSWPYFLFIVLIIIPMNCVDYANGYEKRGIILACIQIPFIFIFLIGKYREFDNA